MNVPRQRAPQDLPQIIGAALREAQGNYPSLTVTAAQFCVSPRTLKRRLQSQGVRFRELLDAARYRDAAQLLRHSESTVEQIALAVGYSCPANFSRAFRRWSGMPPGIYREALAADDRALQQDFPEGGRHSARAESDVARSAVL
jgi:AraC-like DNA-binding protein